ncbi:hypothetical protein AB0J28_14810 [Streptosporangium canum]|uniref:hypothetical protein n=1 Tax=Streptosporangium canum TaxID=324952 RepID=UPI00342BF908
MTFVYHSGTTLYVSAMATCTSAALLGSGPPSPLFARIAKATVPLIFILYSSPSDIDGTKQAWKTLSKELDDVRAELDGTTSAVNPERWQNMGKQEFEAACKKFYAEIDKTQACCNNIGDSLGGAAMMSMAAAAFCAAGATALLWVAIAKQAARGAGPIATAIAESIATSAGVVYRQGVKTTIVKGGKALLSVGLIIGMGVMLLQWLTSSTTQGLAQAATPTDMKSMPMFEQVVIEGLPPSLGKMPSQEPGQGPSQEPGKEPGQGSGTVPGQGSGTGPGKGPGQGSDTVPGKGPGQT